MAFPKFRLPRIGDLVLRSAAGDVHWNKPFIYQTVGESRKVIPGGFKRIGKHLIGFQIGQYDASRALIIDPVVMNYATYLGDQATKLHARSEQTLQAMCTSPAKRVRRRYRLLRASSNRPMEVRR